MTFLRRCRYLREHGPRIQWLFGQARIDTLLGAEDARGVRLRHQEFFRGFPPP